MQFYDNIYPQKTKHNVQCRCESIFDKQVHLNSALKALPHVRGVVFGKQCKGSNTIFIKVESSGLHELGDCLKSMKDLCLHSRLANSDEGRQGGQGAQFRTSRHFLGVPVHLLGHLVGDGDLLD